MTRHPKYPEYVLVRASKACDYFERERKMHPVFGNWPCAECPEEVQPSVLVCSGSCTKSLPSGMSAHSAVWVKEVTAVTILLEDETP